MIGEHIAVRVIHIGAQQAEPVEHIDRILGSCHADVR